MDTLKALSDETRLRIVNLLVETELCVCDLMAVLDTSQTKISRHLAYLKHADLVRDRKHAQWSFYSLIKEDAVKFIQALVYEDLRQTEPYTADLKRLNERQSAGVENERICCGKNR